MAISILFVSTGSTCRAPMAVGTLRNIVRRAGIERVFDISSAGTTEIHIGQPPTLLAVEAAARRGYDIADLRARHLTPEDISSHDYVLAMDRTHLATMRLIAPSGYMERPRMFLKFAPSLGVVDIVDPYGGSNEDYENVLDLIEAGCVGLLKHLQATLEGMVA